jgi:predicted double-glycine peptidase
MTARLRTGLSQLLRVRHAAALLCLGLVGCQTFDEVSQSPVRKPISYTTRKYAVTVRQQYDFTCGGAALATILTHYWGRPTKEVEVLDFLKQRYPGHSWDALQKKGFSLEDLIFVANKLGFEAQAASLPADELAKLDGPVIVHVKKGDYEHFTVLRKRAGGRTYISDPVLGAIVRLDEEFDQEYTGAALAVWKTGAPLPKATQLARPYPPLDPSAILGGPVYGRQPYYAVIF